MIHTGEEVLCAARHDTSDRCKLLGPDLRDNAIIWVTEYRAPRAGLPTTVVKSFIPSEACLCRCYSPRHCAPPATVHGALGSLSESPGAYRP